MKKFKKGQLVKSDHNADTTYKVKTIHRNGDMTIQAVSWYGKPLFSGPTFRILHGPRFNAFGALN